MVFLGLFSKILTTEIRLKQKIAFDDAKFPVVKDWK